VQQTKVQILKLVSSYNLYELNFDFNSLEAKYLVSANSRMQ